jgi:hypothetical protein
MHDLRPGNTFTYKGEAWPVVDGVAVGDSIDIEEVTLIVEEYWPYEPSNYVHEPTVTAYDSITQAMYDIPVAYIDEYHGYCADCGQKHGNDPIDCPFRRAD